METATYLESQFIAQVRHEAVEARKGFIFMLPNPLGSGWFMENRYATASDLDEAVETFTAEYQDDFEGALPINGRDFLAVKIAY